MLHETITQDIIGAAMAVLNELKPGLDEKVYENALVIELRARGHSKPLELLIIRAHPCHPWSYPLLIAEEPRIDWRGLRPQPGSLALPEGGRLTLQAALRPPADLRSSAQQQLRSVLVAAQGQGLDRKKGTTDSTDGHG